MTSVPFAMTSVPVMWAADARRGEARGRDRLFVQRPADPRTMTPAITRPSTSVTDPWTIRVGARSAPPLPSVAMAKLPPLERPHAHVHVVEVVANHGAVQQLDPGALPRHTHGDTPPRPVRMTEPCGDLPGGAIHLRRRVWAV